MSVGKLLFSYHGRISVAYFWLGWLLQVLFVIVLAVAVIMTALHLDPQLFDENRQGKPDPAAMSVILTGVAIWLILGTVMNFAVMVKRCHDRNKSGWFSLLALIPYVGFFWWVIDLGILEGHHGPNQYGPDPQNRPPRGTAVPGAGQWTAAAQANFDPDQLRKLKALLDDGLITKEEFERKRQQLVGI
jgi:uncharacterized membrane protein YhaH (DUF805 family)